MEAKYILEQAYKMSWEEVDEVCCGSPWRRIGLWT